MSDHINTGAHLNAEDQFNEVLMRDELCFYENEAKFRLRRLMAGRGATALSSFPPVLQLLTEWQTRLNQLYERGADITLLDVDSWLALSQLAEQTSLMVTGPGADNRPFEDLALRACSRAIDIVHDHMHGHFAANVHQMMEALLRRARIHERQGNTEAATSAHKDAIDEAVDFGRLDLFQNEFLVEALAGLLASQATPAGRLGEDVKQLIRARQKPHSYPHFAGSQSAHDCPLPEGEPPGFCP